MRFSYFPIDRLTALQALRVRTASCGAWLRLWVASGCIASGPLACATVTQEEPPSNQTGSQGGGGGSGGVAQGGSANGGSNSSFGGSSSLGGSTGNGGSGVSQGGSGGSGVGGSSQGGTGGSSVFVPPQSIDAGIPPGELLFQDTFDPAPSPEWFTSPGSAWTVTTDPGATGNVYSQTATEDSNAGFLAAAGATTLTDVIVQADFKVVSFDGGSSGYMAGLCVRVADGTNFYMVGMRSNNDFPLQLRKFGTGATILTDADIELALGVWYQLRVEAIGTTLTAYLDGELMFTQNDASLPAGGFGLCTAQASAMFDNVFVTDPTP